MDVEVKKVKVSSEEPLTPQEAKDLNEQRKALPHIVIKVMNDLIVQRMYMVEQFAPIRIYRDDLLGQLDRDIVSDWGFYEKDWIVRLLEFYNVSGWNIQFHPDSAHFSLEPKPA